MKMKNRKSRIKNQESTEKVGTTSFVQLNVWKAAHHAVMEIYRVTRKFPDEERYGLTAQMRRAAVSIPANIAEGCGRRKPQDKARFYNISQGSTEELKYHLILANDLNYLSDSAPLWNALEEVSRMLRKLAQATLDS